MVRVDGLRAKITGGIEYELRIEQRTAILYILKYFILVIIINIAIDIKIYLFA